jgi:hypothetical protein
MGDQNGAHEADHPGAFERYVLPALVTISALSFMAVATSGIGVWRDVSVMRENMSTLVKKAEANQKDTDELTKQVQNHEVRITRGGL